MFKLLVMVALCTPVVAMAATPNARNADPQQIAKQDDDFAIEALIRLAMGPDPGGHTGDGVTPTTTKSGQSGDNNQGTGQSNSSNGTSGDSQKSKPDATSGKPGDSSGNPANKAGTNR